MKTLHHEARALQRAALEKEREETAEAEDEMMLGMILVLFYNMI